MNLGEKLQHPLFGFIRRRAQQEDLHVYVVGGFVRDLLLERESTDIDCVVSGNGIAFCEALCKDIAEATGEKPQIQVFEQFGTCKFQYDNREVEFVGARKEVYTPGSRKPHTEAGSLEDDQYRRDFSINAMALSLSEGDFGELLDPFEGVYDLQEHLIRSHRDPDQSFKEDPLRMFRAVRFAAQLYFDIESDTFEAIIRNAEEIKTLSAERITGEFNKILLAPQPSYGLRLLDAAGLLPLFFPELIALKGVETIHGKSHKDNFEHTLEVLDHVAYAHGNLYLRWAALLHDIAKPRTKKFDPARGWTFHSHEFVGGKMVPEIFRRFKLPLDENMRFVKKMVEMHLRPIIIAEDIVTDSAVRRLAFEAGEDINDLIMLGRADITSKNREKVARYQNNFQIVEKKLRELAEKDYIRLLQPVVSGNEIMEHYGIPPCREVGILKTRVKDAVINGDIANTAEENWRLIKEIAAEIGLKEPACQGHPDESAGQGSPDESACQGHPDESACQGHPDESAGEKP